MAYRKQITNGLCKSLLISNYFKFNGLKTPIKSQRLVECMLTMLNYMMSVRVTPQIQRYKQFEKERMENIYPCKQYQKEIWCCYTDIRQNRL